MDLLARTDFMEKAGTGIKRVTDACNANGNKCNFSFSDAFWVKMKSNVTNKVTDKDDEKVVDKVVEKVADKVADKLTDNQKNIIALIKLNPYVSARELAPQVGISHRKIQENIAKLKEYGIIKRIGSPKGGYWKVTE